MKKIKIPFIKNIPLFFTVLYLLFTLFLYKFGPIAWGTYNPIKFWILQFLYITMFVIGWLISQKRKGRNLRNTSFWNESLEKKLLKNFWIFLTINLIIEIINLFRHFYMTSFNFIELFNKIKIGFSNMGDSYSMFQANIGIKGSEIVGGNLMTLINYCWMFFGFVILLLGMLFFKKMKIREKLLEVLTITIIIIRYISTGTNIGFFRIILAIVVFFSINTIKSRLELNSKNWKKRRNILLILLIFSIVFASILFNAIMVSRGGILHWNSSSYNIGGFLINHDSFLIRILPDNLIMFLISATSYLTQGYVGMSMSLTLPWEPTYGIGFSKALTDLSSKYITDFFEVSSYSYRVEQVFGWDADVHWHSMYTWFANDLTFIGVIFVMFVLGYILYKVYIDSLKTNNPFAKILFYYLVMMIFFIPCNNQIFQSISTMFPFFTTVILWLYFRGTFHKISFLKRRNKNEK